VTVARPSDGPTDPSCWSRGADPVLEREINKIIIDDRRGRFSPPHLRACESTGAPARAHQTGAGDSAIPRCSKVSEKSQKRKARLSYKRN